MSKNLKGSKGIISHVNNNYEDFMEPAAITQTLVNNIWLLCPNSSIMVVEGLIIFIRDSDGYIVYMNSYMTRDYQIDVNERS